jgi:hypothetical protein
MLVKFLSYVASIIGARRYKPILISLAALTLTVTGITMVASALTGDSRDIASFEQNQPTGEQTTQPASSELKGLNKQQTIRPKRMSRAPSQPHRRPRQTSYCLKQRSICPPLARPARQPQRPARQPPLCGQLITKQHRPA